jgi:hypothetical protein
MHLLLGSSNLGIGGTLACQFSLLALTSLSLAFRLSLQFSQFQIFGLKVGDVT